VPVWALVATEFQSLVGAMRTGSRRIVVRADTHVSIPRRGNEDSASMTRSPEVRISFQSLVGAMRTCPIDASTAACSRVSIPRRGNEDGEPQREQLGPAGMVSIPRRGNEDRGAIADAARSALTFQSLVGAMRTGPRTVRLRGSPGFNPS